MRTKLILAEDWQEMKDAVSTASFFLGITNVTIDTERRNVNVSDPAIYETRKKDGVVSLSPLFIYGLFSLEDQANYDCLGIMVDKSKTIEHMGLYGQQSTLGNGKQVIEIYCDRKAGKKLGLQRIPHSTIHELLHALADFHGVKDDIHTYIEDSKNKTLDGYREQILDRILEKKSKWGLLPETERLAQVLLDKYPQIKLLEGYRSPERQDELFKQKPKVTNAKAWQSMHQYRVAFDYCFTGKVAFPPSGDPKWNLVNSFAKSIGFHSYGIDENFDDGHLELLFGNSEKKVMSRDIDWTQYWKAPKTPPLSLKFARNLKEGMKGEDVTRLQKYLNHRGFLVSKEGAGSSGSETDYFGTKTKNALIRFQKAHNISPTGTLGPITRKFIG